MSMMGGKRRFSLGFLGCLTALATLVQTSRTHAVEGGALAQARDQLARATVAVGTLLQPGGGFRVSHCSGVLIGTDMVLTAAHCVRDNPVEAVVFFYQGSRPIRSPHRVAAISRYAVAPGRIPSDDLASRLGEVSLDVALLRLATPVVGRTPIPLARNMQQVPSTLRLAGVGLSGRAAGTLKTAVLRPLLMTETGLTIANTVGARVCIGDSGGPVVVPTRAGPLLLGVASAVITPQAPCGSIVMIAPAVYGSSRSFANGSTGLGSWLQLRKD
jgi:hypothetical protein